MMPEYEICEDCGQWLYEGDLVYEDGTYIYCQECATKNLFKRLEFPDEFDRADRERKDRAV